jgi:hypothetical protein
VLLQFDMTLNIAVFALAEKPPAAKLDRPDAASGKLSSTRQSCSSTGRARVIEAAETSQPVRS